ncbi:MAG: type VI secretion system baseplate subunit TssF [Gemmatimonadetes bacterium]|nr:type VI secretion system baseplate subunit TssF [Gemmatimonadota bacterium]
MRDDRILDYYERELTFLRQLGAEFADTYKAVASRLRIEATKAEDPHVERLLQGFAFLAARVHLKIDDDFPEISQALLNVIYPHYLRPLPSMSLAEFRLDPDQATQATGWRIPRGARLVTPPTTSGTRCRFRTAYETTLWPLEVRGAGWHSAHEVKGPSPTSAFAVLRVDLETLGQLSLDDLEIPELRFYLDGEPGLVGSLYELLLNNCVEVVAWNPNAGAAARPVRLPSSAVHPVGFDAEQGMLPYPGRSFLPYRMIQEYFAFPQKYFFVDVKGLDRLAGAGLGTSLQLLFYISKFQRPERHARLQEGVGDHTMRLFCAPVVNLFPAEARPINLNQRKTEYQVTVQGDAEVFSIEEVFAISPGSTERIPFVPFYALRHRRSASDGGLFWYSKRERRGWGESSASNVSIALVDLDGTTVYPEFHSVGAKVLCSNGNLPNELPFGTTESDLHLEEESAPLIGIFMLTAPTRTVRPPLGGEHFWRLVSMLSLNQLSLVDRGAGAFREMIRLHDFGASTLGERHVEGITAVRGEPLHAPVQSDHGLAFARGKSIEIEFDEEAFTGGSVFLFASVLERFLAQYASLNSFSRLVARTKQRPEILKAWPPRAGNKPLL